MNLPLPLLRRAGVIGVTWLSLNLAPITISSAFAQEESSRLGYTAPRDWTRSIDGTTLSPTGSENIVAMTFTPSLPFVGTAEQWSVQVWDTVARGRRLVSGPIPGTQGAFLTRMGVFQQADGTHLWLVLNTLVKDGRGESVIFLARDEAQFRAHLPTVSTMLRGATVASAQQSAAKRPAPAAPSVPDAVAPVIPPGPASQRVDDVAGLYAGSKYGFTFDPQGRTLGSGWWGMQVEYYLLSRDGRVFHARTRPEVPEGDISRFDYDAARRRQPRDCGTYTVGRQEIILMMGEAPHEKVIVTRTGPDELEINKVNYTRTLRDPSRSGGSLQTPATSAAAPLPAESASAAISSVIEALPTLVYQAPPGFTEPSGLGFHEAKPYWHARVEVYDFRRFSGKNFEQEFRATRFREWIAPDRREDRLADEPTFETGKMEGASQVITSVFAEEFEGPRIGTGDRRVPRLRIRTAILASGAVAIVEMMVRDNDAFQKHQASLAAFTDSLKILPAPTPMAGDEILAIAGVWEWNGNPVPATGPVAFLHDARARMECYVFSVDGRVAWRGKPSGDIRGFDFDAAKAVSADSVGTYFKRGNQLVLRFGNPPFYVYHADIKKPDTLEILGFTYHRTQRAAR